jgi:prevent-host-death family protein
MHMKARRIFTVTEARAQFFQLLKLVESGEEVVIINTKERTHNFRITPVRLDLPQKRTQAK